LVVVEVHEQDRGLPLHKWEISMNVDETGQSGGFNFQWASGAAAGGAV
jgi:hypothetical protein